MKLSLVVPCYNEEQNVALFCNEATKVFDAEGYEYELVFVNDGSKDHTLSELKRIHAMAKHNIRIVSFSRNFGKEAAMYAGIEHAKGDLICLIDADLQQRPEVAAHMVRMLDASPELDCVAAFQQERLESGTLSFFKKSFYKIINSVSDTNFTQGASDFRTFRRNVAESVLSMGEYHRFSKGILSWVGFNTEYIPYEVQERAAGESKWSFKKLFKYAVDGIMAFSTAPLAIPLVLGLGLCALSFVYLIAALIWCAASYYTYFSTDMLVLFAVMLIGGLQLAGIGIVGRYIAKIYEQSKDRPIYIAKEIIEPKNEK